MPGVGLYPEVWHYGDPLLAQVRVLPVHEGGDGVPRRPDPPGGAAHVDGGAGHGPGEGVGGGGRGVEGGAAQDPGPWAPSLGRREEEQVRREGGAGEEGGGSR